MRGRREGLDSEHGRECSPEREWVSEQSGETERYSAREGGGEATKHMGLALVRQLLSHTTARRVPHTEKCTSDMAIESWCAVASC